MASPVTATPASHFYFNCTLNRPRIHATISVSFHEEPQILVAGSHLGGTDAGTDQDAALQTQKEDKLKGKAPIDEEAGSSHRMGRLKHGSATHENKPAADVDMGAYRCLIIEEPPPPPDG